jgi:hypothetical protein
MNFYWLYNLSNIALFFLIVGVITAIVLMKPIFFPNYFERKWHVTKKSNDFVIAFLTLTGAFLSITLGLIAVGTFDTFKSSEDIVAQEASALAALYQDVQLLEKPEKQPLLDNLKEYNKFVIEVAWPQQQKGIIPVGANKITDAFRQGLKAYQPGSSKDLILFTEVFNQFNNFYEKRRMRLGAVKNALPPTIYIVLIMGLLLNIVISWLIHVENRKLEILVNALTGILAGSLVFIIVALDNPFRGNVSVSAEPFEMLQQTIMK